MEGFLFQYIVSLSANETSEQWSTIDSVSSTKGELQRRK